METPDGTPTTSGHVPLPRSEAKVESTLNARAEIIDRRTSNVLNELTAVCGAGSESRLIRVIAQAIASQHDDGSWGSDDYPRLKPCFTAQTIDLLWRLGIRYSAGTRGHRAAAGPAHIVRQALEWLTRVQNADGTWGEDAWDTCQVLRSFFLCGVDESQENVQRGLAYIRSCIDGGWPDKTSFWFGPGFQGAAMEVFNSYGDAVYAKRALDQVWQYWDETQGCFRITPGSDEVRRAPADWHTATTLVGLDSFGSVSPRPLQREQAASWLRSRQTDDGCWSPGHSEITCYATTQAVVALAHSDHDGQHAARRGTDWLIDKCGGPDGALSVKLMSAAAIARTHAPELVARVSFFFLTNVADLMAAHSEITKDLRREVQRLHQAVQLQQADFAQLQVELGAVRHELGDAADELIRVRREAQEARAEERKVRDELAGYAYKLTGNQLAVVSAFLTLITFAVGLLVAWALAQ